MISHVGLILDGNRRFAKKHGKTARFGHGAGAKKFSEALRWLEDAGVHEVSAYVLSTENLNRTQEEVNDLFELFVEYAEKIFAEIEKEKRGARAVFAGNLELVPEHIRKHARALEERTAHFEKRVNLCFSYGGRDEIVRAANAVIAKGEGITQETLSAELDIVSEPDLVIRTGGKHRTSNFLLWQTAYSEWFFVDKLWPEVEKKDILDCLESFETIKRNFGK